MEQINKMMSAWGQMWDDDYELKMQKDPNVIDFVKQNPYMDENTTAAYENLLAKAYELIEQQKMQEAIMCLEAEVQKNSPETEAWRLLGSLYQEND
jgi:hypothetical protein